MTQLHSAQFHPLCWFIFTTETKDAETPTGHHPLISAVTTNKAVTFIAYWFLISRRGFTSLPDTFLLGYKSLFDLQTQTDLFLSAESWLSGRQ